MSEARDNKCTTLILDEVYADLGRIIFIIICGKRQHSRCEINYCS